MQAHGELVGEEDSELLQNKSPKIDAKTLAPATYEQNPDQEWCAPQIKPVRHQGYSCKQPLLVLLFALRKLCADALI